MKCYSFIVLALLIIPVINPKIATGADQHQTGVRIENGVFRFDNESLETILGQVSRYYQMNLTWEDESLKKIRFTGAISSARPISDLLHMLELSAQIKFKVTGKMITVAKK